MIAPDDGDAGVAKRLLDIPPDVLKMKRDCGGPGTFPSTAGYLRSVAEKYLERPAEEDAAALIRGLDDAGVMRSWLIYIEGCGPATLQTIAIRWLRRRDVLPVGDKLVWDFILAKLDQPDQPAEAAEVESDENPKKKKAEKKEFKQNDVTAVFDLPASWCPYRPVVTMLIWHAAGVLPGVPTLALPDDRDDHGGKRPLQPVAGGDRPSKLKRV